MKHTDTIVAMATPAGAGAIAVIRLSGPNAISIASTLFTSVSGKILSKQKTHTVHLGYFKDGDKIIDEVLATIFKNPNSYTGEDVVEISCHGSNYIQQEIIQLCLRKGCRMAQAGEFTLRAFLNGKMDLSQAEAVADLIASDSAASHQLAIQQMRGGFSSEIKKLREELLNFASLIELELDFAEEDVEFANREEFQKLISKITQVLKRLIDSFASGNVLKNGIPVAIVGEPNVGKSTLLNALLNEDRAIVSHIAGTTRDTIEDEIIIGGVIFRFIDTAGIRETADLIEAKGVERTLEKMKQAKLIIYMADAEQAVEEIEEQVRGLEHQEIPFILLINKSDLLSDEKRARLKSLEVQFICAKEKLGVEELKDNLLHLVNISSLNTNETILTNIRHVEALRHTEEALNRVLENVDNPITSDFLAMDIKQALHYLGEIVGEVTTDDLLDNIFSKFCIGK